MGDGAPRKPTAPSSDGVLRRHALVVGIDRYQPQVGDLHFCAQDANQVGDVLAARGYRVLRVHDGPNATAPPTRDAVRAAMTALFGGPDAADADDVVVAHFSCHGQILDGRPYLLMADTPADRVEQDGLPLSEVLERLRGKPRWVAIFLDACHMGLGFDPAIGQSAVHSLEHRGGFALLSGSTADYVTLDSTEGYGIFTRQLVGGLAGAAAGPDGAVSFGALARHVQDGVQRWNLATEGRIKGSTQKPVMRVEVADIPILPAHDYLELEPRLPAKLRAAAFSPDGARLVTASEDTTVRLWSPSSRRPVLATMDHRGHVGGVAFSSDGELIASASNDGFTKIWQTSGANEITPGPAWRDAILAAVAWSPDRSSLASVGADGIVVYQLDAIGRPIGSRRLEGHVGTVWAVAYAPDGRLLTGGADGTVRTWNPATGACKLVWKAWDDGGSVWALAVSPDGRFVTVGGVDPRSGPNLHNQPRIWDRKTGKVVATLRGHRGGVTAIAYAAGGDRVATSSYDSAARVFATDGSARRTLAVADEVSAAYGVAWSPDQRTIFVGYASGRGRLFTL